MLKIDYQFSAKQPIHTGSDSNTGILRQLRRQKVLLQAPKPVYSRFRPEQKRLKREAVALLLLRLWDKMKEKGRVTIYEEVHAKLIASTTVPTKEQFLQVLCRKLEVREITAERDWRFDAVDLLDLFDDYELLELVRTESQYLLTMFRRLKDDVRAYKGEVETHPAKIIQDALAVVASQPIQELPTRQTIDFVPVISGNSIRGVLRRVCMYDFCKRAGITGLTPQVYHQLFTGGTINDITAFENIEQRQRLIRFCPMLGLFGSAIGNQTIQGELRVGQATLVCAENGNCPVSYHEQIEVDFGTRLDSGKQETDIRIQGDPGGGETHQMKYEYEVFCRGAEFQHNFACMSDDELLESTFFHLLLPSPRRASPRCSN